MKYSCKNILQYILRGLLSHVGTLILIILYLVGGGFLFILLELENEKSACFSSLDLLKQKLNDTTYRGMAISTAGSNATVFYQQLYTMLFNFSKDVYALSVSPSKDCSTLGTSQNLPNWNLANSIFFCATIVTTIGYGNLYPITAWGRIVCIIYGFVGIPLMLLFLGNFGEVLADVFRYVYVNLCCCLCFVNYKRRNEEQFIEEISTEKEPIDGKSLENLVSVPPPKIVTDDDLVVLIDDIQNPDEINIPLTIVVSFLVFYMFLGAFLFRIWETWDMTAAVYFSFITVSTIGFGDLYPAKDTIGSSDATVELLAAAAYCVVGLAVLSMCLALVKEEIVGKFLWFGEKLGLTKANNPNFNEAENFEDCNDDSNIVHLSGDRKVSKFDNEAYTSTLQLHNNDFSSKFRLQ